MSCSNETFALRHSGPDETLSLQEQILPVYVASHSDLIHDPWFTPDQFWARLRDLYIKTPDFDLVTGWLDGLVIGYAFGSTRDTRNPWSDICKAFPHLQPDGPVYVFREFAVTPSRQRRGYGRRIHDELLRERHEQAAHLVVRPENHAAIRAYNSWGWRKIGTLKPFPDSPTFDALALDLTVYQSESVNAQA